MNESRFWDKVRGALKKPPRAYADKQSDQFIAGKPDCLWAIEGKMGFLELKYTEWPKREDTGIKVELTMAQRLYLETIAATGNRAQVLLGVSQEWFLLEIHEVPMPDGAGSPRLSRAQLDGVRRQGRAGSMKKLSALYELLAKSPDPVDD